jgi:hypothetical protein
VASTYRELRGSRVGATKICVKVCEVARGDILATRRLACGPQSAIKKDRWHRKSGIRDPMSVSSTHCYFMNSKFPIGKRTVVSWFMVHMRKGVSLEELRGCRVIIGDRESGIREESDSRP